MSHKQLATSWDGLLRRRTDSILFDITSQRTATMWSKLPLCQSTTTPTDTHTHTTTLSQLHSLVTMWNTTQISHLITKNVRRSFFRWCNMLLQRCNDSSLSWNACAKSMAEKSKWCCFVYGEVEEKIAQQPHLSVFYVTFSYYKSMTTKCTDEETLKTKK